MEGLILSSIDDGIVIWKKKYFYLLYSSLFMLVYSFCMWIFFISPPEVVSIYETKMSERNFGNAINKVVGAYSENDHKTAFSLILKNNLKNCILNISGGAMLGITTLLNLVFNGFFSAEFFINYHNAGVSIESIMKATLPHSFELIGLWLSGALGFYVMWNIIQAMKEKNRFGKSFYRTICICSFLVFLITILAAYVEAFITPQIK